MEHFTHVGVKMGRQDGIKVFGQRDSATVRLHTDRFRMWPNRNRQVGEGNTGSPVPVDEQHRVITRNGSQKYVQNETGFSWNAIYVRCVFG